MNRESGAELNISSEDLFDLSRRTESMSYVAGYGFWSGVPYRDVDGIPRSGRRASVTPGFFELLNVPPLAGRWITRDEQEGGTPPAVLSYEFVSSRFDAPEDAVGTVLQIQGVDHLVVGVMPRGFTFPGNSQFWLAEFIASNIDNQSNNSFGRDNRWLAGVGRIGSGYTLEEVRSELSVISSSLEASFPRTNTNYQFAAEPMFDELVGKVSGGLLLLLAMVGAVLFVACTNIANLMLARGASRQSETALRTALGASRSGLVVRALSESVLLALIGGALGTSLAYATVDWLIAAVPTSIPRAEEIGLDLRVALIMIGVSAFAGIGVGLVPALRYSNPDLRSTLVEGPRAGTSRSRHRVQSALVVSQVTASTVLAVAAFLLAGSYVELSSTDPGFRPDRLQRVGVSPPSELMIVQGANDMWSRSRPFFVDILNNLREQPTVESAALHNGPAIVNPGGGFRAWFHIEGTPDVERGARPTARLNSVSDDYFETLGVPLIRGRTFTMADNKTAPGVIIVNRAFADRYFPDTDPIGQRLTKPQFWAEYPQVHEVVGVVENIRHDGLYAEPQPSLYLPFQQAPIGNMSVIARMVPGANLEAPIEEIIWNRESNIPLEVHDVSATIQASNATLRFTMFVVVGLGVTGVLLAALGIYGVLSYSVSMRTHEIGVRMAFGALRGAVVRLFVGRAMILVVGGVAVGTGLAVFAARYANTVLEGVQTPGIRPFFLASVLFAAVGLISAWIPAWRAGRIDPLEILRDE